MQQAKEYDYIIIVAGRTGADDDVIVFFCLLHDDPS
jgi:hypothetical protein